MSRLSTWVVPAYAKVNLSLSVVGRRADGWHDIDSVLVPVDWHDLVGLSLEPAGSDSLSLTVDGPAAPGVPTGDANLTVRAARALRTLADQPLAIRVWLSKSVPHGAGLGGGSADAAAVLRCGVAVLASIGVTIDPARVAAAALDVGSDVPALLSLSAQRVRGRGDRLETLSTPALHLAVASTTASHAGRPAFLRSSICTIKITELRIRMPISASTPRIATKPRGAPLGSKASTTPINASGATANTRNSRWKLCS